MQAEGCAVGRLMALLPRVLLSAMLLAAGVLKVVTPDPAGWLGVRGAVVIGVLELVCAVGVWSRWRWLVTHILAGVAVGGVLIGVLGLEQSCGCAGKIKLSHWQHMAAASALGLCAIAASTAKAARPHEGNAP